jgi:hypothetical protein
MRSMQTLPENYQEARTIDIKKDRRLFIIFNIGAFVLLIAAGAFFIRMISMLRPEGMVELSRQLNEGVSFNIFTIIWLLAITVGYVLLHEAVHGIFFWLYTRSKPKFALRWYYAYAAAPTWYIPRNQYLVTALAPLVVISVIGLLVITISPPALFLPIWFFITMNASGAIGDILVAVWLLFKPSSGMIRDQGDAITLFIRT